MNDRLASAWRAALLGKARRMDSIAVITVAPGLSDAVLGGVHPDNAPAELQGVQINESPFLTANTVIFENIHGDVLPVTLSLCL